MSTTDLSCLVAVASSGRQVRSMIRLSLCSLLIAEKRRVFIPGEVLSWADEVGFDAMPDTAGGEGVTGCQPERP
jgi:hypothetical protein